MKTTPHIPTTGHMKSKRQNEHDAEKWRRFQRACAELAAAVDRAGAALKDSKLFTRQRGQVARELTRGIVIVLVVVAAVVLLTLGAR